MSKLTMKLRTIISMEVEDEGEEVGGKHLRQRKLKRHFQNFRLWVKNFSSQLKKKKAKQIYHSIY